MSSKSIRHTFLGLSIVTGLLALIFYALNYSTSPSATEDIYLRSTQSQLNAAFIDAQTQLSSLNVTLPEVNGKLIHGDLPAADNPYFLYKNGQLVYWSSNKYVPDYGQISGLNKAANILKDGDNVFVAVFHPVCKPAYRCVTLIPLQTAEDGYNSQIFMPNPSGIIFNPNQDRHQNMFQPDGKYLFSVDTPAFTTNPQIPLVSLNILAVAYLFFLIFAYLQVGNWIRLHKFENAFLLYAVLLAAGYWLLITNNIPLVKYRLSLFDPQQYSGTLPPVSLGERMMSAAVWVLLSGFIAIYFYRSRTYIHILRSKTFTKSIVSVLCVVVVVFLTYLLRFELKDILMAVSNNLTYLLNIVMYQQQIALLIYYLLLGVIFFLVSHSCLFLFTRLQPQKKTGVLHWAYGFFLSLILVYILDEIRWVYAVSGFFFLLGYINNLAAYFYIFRFRTSLYFFLSGFVFSVVCVSSIKSFRQKDQLLIERQFAQQLMTDNDIETEGVLATTMRKIGEDTVIVKAIQGQVLAREQVIQQIRTNYIHDFLNGYRTDVMVFDSTGHNLDVLPGQPNLNNIKSTLIESKSVSPNVFKQAISDDVPVVYYGFAPVKSGQRVVGTVVVELLNTPNVKQQESYQNRYNRIIRIYPQAAEYNFAVYDKNHRLIKTEGDFNYVNKWDSRWLQDPELYHNGIIENDYRHFAEKNKDGRIIVVSTPDHELRNIWANLSFFYLISVTAASIVLLFYNYRYHRRRAQLSLTTRIQLYINTAFLFPLLLILIITITVLGSTLRENQSKGFRENTNNVVSTIRLLYKDYVQGKISVGYFKKEAEDVAKSVSGDFDIYAGNGHLFDGSPVPFQQVVESSEYLWPLAYSMIIEDNEQQLLQEEKSGKLIYKTVYAAINVAESPQRIVLRVPYYDAIPTLNKQLTNIFSSILSIFIGLFVLLLIASSFVSQQLTRPLRAVTNRMRKMNLEKLNEPLPMPDSAYEMSVLVRAYNKMLSKLEENKRALSLSEKQIAWREMAKQVAHEIKNPLTPMKLSIQQLQRTLPTENPKTRNLIERALNSLIEQIDNISEIANSFSEFAKMPVPRTEDFNIVEVARNTVDLYTNNKNLRMQMDIADDKIMVRGDRQLASRVLTNLIINGIQSVPNDRTPEIKVSVYRNFDGNLAVMEIQDNGSGIAESIRERVFMPNFSTKVGGSGLGLAMAKRGIEQGGGNIWFETTEGEGTTFYVDLPLVPVIHQ